MASAVPFQPRRFVPDRYEPNSGRLVDLARQRGRDQGESIRRGGEISANLWSGIGQNVSGTLRELAAMPEQARQRQMQDTRLKREEAAYTAQQQQQQQDAANAAKLKELTGQFQGQRVPTEILVQNFGPGDAADISKAFDEMYGGSRADQQQARIEGNELGAQLPPGAITEDQLDLLRQSPAQAGRTRYSFGPGTAEGPELMPTQAQVADTRNREAATAQATAAAKALAARTATDDARADAAAAEARRHNRVVENKPTGERAKFWVMRDGQPMRISDAEYRPGDQPASNREQGRPVTSGDAGRIAEFDTSLDDLGVLTKALAASGSTGTSAKIGANTWNWITELTGWGSDAKKKQAMIDRVKQVIGKALEGGVLRKEDEIKYEKILPTIGDPNELVLSKLQGIDSAIKQRRSRQIDALTDANYDTSKFGDYKAPLSGNTQAVPDLAGLKEGFKARIKDGPFAGQEWTLVNGQPVRVK